MFWPKDKDWPNGYKNKTPIYSVYKIPTSNLGTHTDWKWRVGKGYFHANGDQNKAGIAICISDKINFEKKTMIRDKEGHYIIIKGSIQEDTTIINIYVPNTGAPQHLRQMLTNMKVEINSNKIIVRDFSTPLTPKDRWTKQKVSNGHKL